MMFCTSVPFSNLSCWVLTVACFAWLFGCFESCWIQQGFLPSGKVGHKIGSVFVFLDFGRPGHIVVCFSPVRPCWSYDRLIPYLFLRHALAFFKQLGFVEMDSAPVYVQRLCCCLHILSVIFDILFKIATDQSIRFSCLQSNSVENMSFLSCSPSWTALAAFRSPGDNPVAATTAVSTSSTLAMKLPS